MSRRPTFWGLHYSPWTIRARWSLQHHGIAHRYREHVPMLGEPLLRFAARRIEGRASVPLLVDGEEHIGDSFAIMEYADRRGGAESLHTDDPSVAAWASRLEPGLHAVRARVSHRVLQDPDALTEAASAATPRAVARFFRPVARLGVRHLARKYDFEVQEGAESQAPVEAGLEALRAAIGDGPYITDRFSAADIVAAAFLQGIRPALDGPRLPPATARAWTAPDLAERYADLLAYRDAIWRKHGPYSG